MPNHQGRNDMRQVKDSRRSVQLGLFDDQTAAPPHFVERRLPPSRDAAAEPTTVSISADDLPRYPSDVIDLVERSLLDLPTDRCWFTYKDIRRCFGISRATIARRLKDGLVPGIRFCDGRMLEDGAVRRLDRNQLRWLLLAVRGNAARTHITKRQPSHHSR
jgi:hypothetical protein